MRYNLFLVFVLISFIAFSYSGLINHSTELIGGTELNGAGCVCHTVDRDFGVSVWIEGPDTLFKGQTGSYEMYLTGGPAQAGGYNVAGRFGTMAVVDSFSKWDYRAPNELTQAFPLVFPSSHDTIWWEFEYTVSDSSETDTLYSCGLSIVFDGIPDSLDRWNFGPKFPITILDNVVPVELISFRGSVYNEVVELAWITGGEVNNSGFEIQRRDHQPNQGLTQWETIDFINGKGTFSGQSSYSYTDFEPYLGNSNYRLKQIDFNGSFTLSDEIEIEFSPSLSFSLDQNYPNPFNPGTIINWTSSLDAYQSLAVYDVLGNKVAVIVDGLYPAGKHSAEFDGTGLSSGIYYYTLRVGETSTTKKMLLLK